MHALAACAMHAREVRASLEEHVALGPETKILEVGCGPHGVSFFLDVGDVTAVDPLAAFYDDAFAWVREGARGVTTLEARGEDLPFEDGAFDVVITDNVLDHTREPARVLREIHRVLRPRGVLFFAVNVHRITGWALTAAHERVVTRVRRPLDMLAPHPFAFRRQDAVGMLEAAGFLIASERELPHGDHHHGEPRSVLRRLARGAFDRIFPVAYWQAVCSSEPRGDGPVVPIG